MLINIFLNIKTGPYGGGNQFLKALREYFIQKNLYTDDPAKADVVLFNSHHQMRELLKFKRKYPDKVLIHRMDGPVSLIRNRKEFLDTLIYLLNNKIADATVFQSEWSKNKNGELGLKTTGQECSIINAPDPTIFNKEGKTEFDTSRKTKIIATSWATNLSKGFETYQYLDKNLDFSKYEMTFCGNSPFKFKNINQIDPISGNELAFVLKSHDIFLTASKNDPCSNALIEAMHCNLPALALNDGGHPEIIKNGGITYNDKTEIPNLLYQMINRYNDLQNNIQLPDMNDTGRKYVEFIEVIYTDLKNKRNAKRMKPFDTMILYTFIYLQKIVHHLNEIFSRQH
jgi:glycosyltransferase involved in cell wall biosynthesis